MNKKNRDKILILLLGLDANFWAQKFCLRHLSSWDYRHILWCNSHRANGKWQTGLLTSATPWWGLERRQEWHWSLWLSCYNPCRQSPYQSSSGETGPSQNGSAPLHPASPQRVAVKTRTVSLPCKPFPQDSITTMETLPLTLHHYHVNPSSKTASLPCKPIP